MEKINGGLSNEVFKYNNLLFKFYNYSELGLNYEWEELIQKYLHQTKVIYTPQIHQSLIVNNKLIGRIEEFIDSKNVEINEFRNNMKSSALILKNIHQTKLVNTKIPDFFNYLETWEKQILDLENIPNNILTKDFKTILKSGKLIIKNIHETMSQYKIKKIISHNDYQQLNILIDKESNWYLIDWEYSSLNYPFYDIANFFAECAMNNNEIIWDLNNYPTKEKRFEFYSNYFNDFKLSFEQIDIIIFEFSKIVEYVWYVWSIIKYSTTMNPNYVIYGLIRKNNFEKCLSQDKLL